MGASKQVTHYIKGIGTVEVSFPNGEICCRWCPFCNYEPGLRRAVCEITNEFLPYFMGCVGNSCPLMIEEGKENGI